MEREPIRTSHPDLVDYLECLGFEGEALGQEIDRLQATSTKAAPYEAASELLENNDLAKASNKNLKKNNEKPMSFDESPLIFGEGDVNARLMFITEDNRESAAENVADNKAENNGEKTRLLTGEEGQLLDKMLKAMGLSRTNIFIASLTKEPSAELQNADSNKYSIYHEHLESQLEQSSVEVIVCLGTFAAQVLHQEENSIGRLRGRFIDTEWGTRQIKVIATFHPTFLLRNPEMKRSTWNDLQLVMKELGLNS